MPWREFPVSETKTVFTTADVRWSPLVPEDPHGAQVATLWGDRTLGEFGAVVRAPTDPPDVYTLIRQE